MDAPGSTPARSGLRSFDATTFEAVAPIVVFLVANRLGGLRWAVAGATAASVVVTVDRRRRGQPLGRFMPILTALIIARGVVGIATESEDMYFGLGIAGKLVFGLALIVAAATGRPLAEHLAPHLVAVPDAVANHHGWKQAMGAATMIGGLYYLCSGALDVLLYRRNSVEGYVLVRFFANWPLSLTAMACAGMVMRNRLRTIPGAPTLSDMANARLNELTASGPFRESMENS